MIEKREPVVVPMAILAALQVLFGGLAGITGLNGYPMVAAIAALGVLCVGAAQTGVMFWIRGQVTPVEDKIDFDLDHRAPGAASPVEPTRRADNPAPLPGQGTPVPGQNGPSRGLPGDPDPTTGGRGYGP